MRASALFGLVGAVCLLGVTPVLAAEPADVCEAGKLKASSKYAACRLKAEAKGVLKGVAADYTKCDATFGEKFPATETKAGMGVCPTEGDVTAIDGLIEGCAADVADALAGLGLPPVCGDGTVGAGESCDVGNLDGETCVTQGFAGGALACAPGCAFDSSGCYSSRFVDLGATILDNLTGLEWEKKTDVDGVSGGVNDGDNLYTWCLGPYPMTCADSDLPFDGSLATDFLARLNGTATGACFAGKCDWRLPEIAELQSIADPACVSPPCVIDPLFSESRTDYYYASSTTYAFTEFVYSWYASDGVGTYVGPKTATYAARAVRDAD